MPKKRAKKGIKTTTTTAAKRTTKSSPPKEKETRKRKKQEEEIEEGEEKGIEFYECPGERLNELEAQDLIKWGKTLNCKFYVAEENATKEYTFSNGEKDKVCKVN